MVLLCYFCCPGCADYGCITDEEDQDFCLSYTVAKPRCVPHEFDDLATILMRENHWLMPTNCFEALSLYINLIGIIGG